MAGHATDTSSQQLDSSSDPEYARILHDFTTFAEDAALDSQVEVNFSSPSTNAGILTPGSSQDDNADTNWSIRKSTNFTFPNGQASHTRESSLSSSGPLHELPIDNVQYGLSIEISWAQPHEIQQAVFDHHQPWEPIDRVQDSVQFGDLPFEQSHIEQHQAHASTDSLQDNSQVTGHTSYEGHVEQHSVADSFVRDHSILSGVADIVYTADESLPFRFGNEQPWPTLDMACGKTSVVATPGSCHRKGPRLERPSQRSSSAVDDFRKSRKLQLLQKQKTKIPAASSSLSSLKHAQSSNTSTASLSSAGNSPPANVNKPAYGGRSGPLSEPERETTKHMRELHSCWVCHLQRDKCDANEVCQKCVEQRDRRPGRALGCIRDDLTAMLPQFLPLSLTQVHCLQKVSRLVKESMAGWLNIEGYKGVQVNLTVGYGRPMQCVLHEFIPRTQDVTCQLQWVKDASGEVHCTPKISPPLAIMNFEQDGPSGWRRHSHDLEAFIDEVIEDKLGQFESTYCEDQEDEPFRSSLLRQLCQLYRDAPEDVKPVTLRSDVNAALRSIIATDMMLNHLTLASESQDAAISQIRNPAYQNPTAYREYTSPKLVNRQFKSLISKLQEEYYRDVLSRLHNILYTAKGPKKQKTWLSSFVLFLAMAMCQEELEHNRWLRADGDIQRGGNPLHVIDKAAKDSQNANYYFGVVLGLFDKKYSLPRRDAAALETYMEHYNNEAECRFLRGFISNILPYQAILLQRKDQVVTSTTRLYKSRLVGHFLTRFMKLNEGVQNWRSRGF